MLLKRWLDESATTTVFLHLCFLYRSEDGWSCRLGFRLSLAWRNAAPIGFSLGNLPTELLYRLCQIVSCFCRNFIKLISFAFSKISCLFSPYGSWTVWLIAQEQNINILISIRRDLLRPKALDILEGVLICDIVDDNDAICTLIIGWRDSTESLLPCCVPNLELYVLVLHLHCLEPKINTDGGKVAFVEAIFGKLCQNRRLADSRAAYQYQLHKQIVILYHYMS